MKKIITAIGNPKLNHKLLKLPNVKIISKDIQYKEGIIEILEKINDIDIIIISEIIPGNISIIELIEKIKIINNQIKIIIILEEENKLIINKLFQYGIKDIFYNNKTNIIEIINLINDKKIEKEIELKQEIEKLKKIIEANEAQKDKQSDEKLSGEGYIITISGVGGSGKSIVARELAYAYQKVQNKILIVDFDIFNNSLNIMMGIKKIKKN